MTQGFMVGNPWTDTRLDNIGTVEFWSSHSIIADSTADSLFLHCNMETLPNLRRDAQASADLEAAQKRMCNRAIDKASDEMGKIDVYDIYVDVCTPKRIRQRTVAMSKHMLDTSPAYGLSFHIAERKESSGV